MASPASRRELVRFLVLGWIADDYENLTVSIAGPVTEDGARCGLAIERVEIVQALVELVELGWAKAYVPQSNELVEIDGMPPLTDLDGQDGAWFYITEAGLEFFRANRDHLWPFDDEDEIRKDWKPPEN